MAEYIKREPVIAEMQELIDNVSYNYPYTTPIELEAPRGWYEAVIEYIKEQPAAYIQPFKWVSVEDALPIYDGIVLI